METESPRTAPARASAAMPLGGPATKSFAVQLSSTRRGARLARLFAVQHLAEWGVPYRSGLSESAALVTAELAANAVRHCGGTGRDFRLRVLLGPVGGVRVEVTDACRTVRSRRAPARLRTTSHPGTACFSSTRWRPVGEAPTTIASPRRSGPSWDPARTRLRGPELSGSR